MTQQEALEILKSGVNVFLTGEPGAGKTYTINLFIEWLAEEGKEYAVTASTGVAATHINGMTIHSWTGLGIRPGPITSNYLKALEENSFLIRKVCGADVLIIDEVSMLSATTINNIDVILKNLRDNNEPFGGLQIIFVGDFFQLPPVTKGEEMKFAFESASWKMAKLRICYLTEQHRQSDGPFLEILGAMRNGVVTEKHKEILRGRANVDLEGVPTELYTHNADVDRLNKEELEKLTGEPHHYEMEVSGVPYLIDVLKKSCLSPEDLVLKVGAIVMFTRNNFDVGYVNGTIGIISGFSSATGDPIVELKNGGNIIVDEKAEWTMEENGNVKARLKQLPLRLAWAITVHKSQGMSLDAASIDLSRCFEYGQGYVAISRVRSLDGLRLRGINNKAFVTHPKVIEQDKIWKRL